MKMKKFKQLAALLFFVCLFGWLTLSAAGVAQAEEVCPVVHKVKIGENLTSIAAQYGVTVKELVEANASIANPSYIQAGWRLCIPQPPPLMRSLETEKKTVGHVDIVAEYQRSPSEIASEWTLAANLLGIRYAFPLAAGDPVTETIFRMEDDLLKASAPLSPVLWLIRNEPEETPPSYTLAVISDSAPLLATQFPFSPTQTITDIVPINGTSFGCSPDPRPATVLGRGMATDTKVSLELVTPDNTFLRFPVTQLEYWATSEQLINCDSSVILALHPIRGTDFYQLLLVLQWGDGAGAGADAEAILCEDWKEGNVIDKLVWYFKCS